MIDPDLSLADRIGDLVAAEALDAPRGTDAERATVEAFEEVLVQPFETTVTFSGWRHAALLDRDAQRWCLSRGILAARRVLCVVRGE